jgi:hypothetical protein
MPSRTASKRWSQSKPAAVTKWITSADVELRIIVSLTRAARLKLFGLMSGQSRLKASAGLAFDFQAGLALDFQEGPFTPVTY